MFRRSKLTFLNTKDDRIKVINERIALTEKHFVEICTSFAVCTRKLAKYRDAYDELAKAVKSYADEEEINDSLSSGLKSFTTAVTILGDYMDINVQRLEGKIVNELAMFDNVCKSTRENLRNAVAARDKEVLKQRQMLDIKTKFAANTSAADSELVKAKLEVNRTNKEIDEAMSQFERLKISNLKNVLTNFILISLKYHTKALEALSASYYDISSIDEASDLLEFQKIMKRKEEPDSSKNADDLLSPFEKLGKLSKSKKSLNKSDDELMKRQLASSATDEEDNDDEDDDDDDDNDDDGNEDDAEDDEDVEEEESEPTSNASNESDIASADEMLEGAVGGIKKSSNVFGIKQSKPKDENKQPFKTVAATHVQPVKPKRKSKAAAELGAVGGIGIGGIKQSNAFAGIGRPGDRLVTVVKSKPARRTATGKENANEEIIDCSKTGMTGLLFL